MRRRSDEPPANPVQVALPMAKDGLMKFGIFSNQQRHSTDVVASWDEDVAEIQVADRLGFEYAWISEHAGLPYLQDGLACAEHMICRVAAETEQIKLGPAVRRLALYNPIQVAVEMGSVDNLTHGRYVWSFGHGGPVSGYEQRGIRFEDTHAMMIESIDLIMRCLNETEPFDHEGKYYRGTSITVWPRPLQKPHPPIWMASNTPHLIEMAGQRGFNFFLSQYARAATMKQLSGIYTQAQASAGRPPSRENVTALRAVFVGDTDAQAMAAVGPGWREHLEFNKKYFGPVFQEWIPKGGTLDEVTFEHLLDEGLVFVGSPDTVRGRIENFYQESGGFGTFLLVAGKNWGTFAQREHSMSLFAEQVIPKLAGLGAPAMTSVRPAR